MMENKSTKKAVKGFKVFNPDWTCKGFQYEVGKTYEMDESPVCCSRGFYFCRNAADCFSYYRFKPENKVAEVTALGEVEFELSDTKCCTNKIKIVREVPWDELLRIVNTGKDCAGFGNTGNCNTGDRNTGNRNTGDWNTGNCNTGDRNTGNRNTGDWNTGNRNTGDRNTGDRNTGNCNTGNRNTGDRNTGNCNTGDRNTGDWNTGDWNKSSFNAGCFMTKEQKISMFDKPSDWSYEDWLHSGARYILNQIPRNVVEWVCSRDMTDEEKAEHPTHETTGGYLKKLDKTESRQLWWDDLPESKKVIVQALPNFDPDIFEQCTGIKVESCKS